MVSEKDPDTGPGLEGAVSWDYSQTEFPSASASDVIAAVHTASRKDSAASAGPVSLPGSRPKNFGPSGQSWCRGSDALQADMKYTCSLRP